MIKCIMKGCENYNNQGRFVEGLCIPCHQTVVYGKVGPSSNFIRTTLVKIKALLEALEWSESSSSESGTDYSLCPFCGSYGSHLEECELGDILDELGELLND